MATPDATSGHHAKNSTCPASSQSARREKCAGPRQGICDEAAPGALDLLVIEFHQGKQQVAL
jgi:hypothetical protein